MECNGGTTTSQQQQQLYSPAHSAPTGPVPRVQQQQLFHGHEGAEPRGVQRSLFPAAAPVLPSSGQPLGLETNAAVSCKMYTCCCRAHLYRQQGNCFSCRSDDFTNSSCASTITGYPQHALPTSTAIPERFIPVEERMARSEDFTYGSSSRRVEDQSRASDPMVHESGEQFRHMVPLLPLQGHMQRPSQLDEEYHSVWQAPSPSHDMLRYMDVRETDTTTAGGPRDNSSSSLDNAGNSTELKDFNENVIVNDQVPQQQVRRRSYNVPRRQHHHHQRSGGHDITTTSVHHLFQSQSSSVSRTQTHSIGGGGGVYESGGGLQCTCSQQFAQSHENHNPICQPMASSFHGASPARPRHATDITLPNNQRPRDVDISTFRNSLSVGSRSNGGNFTKINNHLFPASTSQSPPQSQAPPVPSRTYKKSSSLTTSSPPRENINSHITVSHDHNHHHHHQQQPLSASSSPSSHSDLPPSPAPPPLPPKSTKIMSRSWHVTAPPAVSTRSGGQSTISRSSLLHQSHQHRNSISSQSTHVTTPSSAFFRQPAPSHSRQFPHRQSHLQTTAPAQVRQDAFNQPSLEGGIHPSSSSSSPTRLPTAASSPTSSTTHGSNNVHRPLSNRKSNDYVDSPGTHVKSITPRTLLATSPSQSPTPPSTSTSSAKRSQHTRISKAKPSHNLKTNGAVKSAGKKGHFVNNHNIELDPNHRVLKENQQNITRELLNNNSLFPKGSDTLCSQCSCPQCRKKQHLASQSVVVTRQPQRLGSSSGGTAGSSDDSFRVKKIRNECGLISLPVGISDEGVQPCPRCGKCDCPSCTEPRELPPCGCCGDAFTCSADKCINMTSCMCLVNKCIKWFEKDNNDCCMTTSTNLMTQTPHHGEASSSSSTVICRSCHERCNPATAVTTTRREHVTSQSCSTSAKICCYGISTLLLPCMLLYLPLKAGKQITTSMYNSYRQAHACHCYNDRDRDNVATTSEI